MMFAAVFGIRPMPMADGPLEPSIQNEVDHAVDLAEAWLRGRPAETNVVTGDLFKTNGLARERIALRLVSSQRGEGWWVTSTNSAPTRTALAILKGL